MVKGIDTAASGMISILNLNDVIANNLANINTPGFKQTQVTFKNFENIMEEQIKSSKDAKIDSSNVGALSAGSILDSTSLDLSQGGIKNTGNPLDVAISGDGFFTVRTPSGDAYTRNGSFMRNQKGILTTTDGYPVIGESGRPITLDFPDKTSTKDLNIDSEGNIQIKGQHIDKFKIVDFKNKKDLQAVGNSLVKPATAQRPVASNDFSVSQGALESANANVVECMVNSITGMRTYETLSKIVTNSNKTLEKAVNSLGQIKR